MRLLTLFLAITLVGCEAQADRTSNRSSDSQRSPGCDVKINDQKVLSQDAVDNVPMQSQNAQFQLKFLYQGRVFQASLKDKQSGEVIELSNSSGGALEGKLTNSNGESLLLNLPISLMEVTGTTSRGDWMKLERDSKDNLLESEIYWRSSTNPQIEINLSCDT